ncbi:MAG: hemolysin III family protein [Corynebacterium sp.]|nr:hemolysin III family protein [Corynebacterium sp.]
MRTKTIKREVADRGDRPSARGWFHFFATFLNLIAGTVLTTYAWFHIAWWQALGVTIYSVGVVLLFGVSAAYHRGYWKSAKTVQWWRRADHATIGVFIAATYTPLCLIVLQGNAVWWMLGTAWAGALVAVLLAMVWIEHPRVIDVVVYLVLGWLIVPLIPQLWSSAGPTVVWLLFAGGLIYSLGALMYGFKWPGRHARHVGYHEYFHAATIIAAICHMIAIWFVVV